MGAQEGHDRMNLQIKIIQKRENAKGQICSDHLQGSEKRILQAVSEAQETLCK
jgi:hypothetical protein